MQFTLRCLAIGSGSHLFAGDGSFRRSLRSSQRPPRCGHRPSECTRHVAPDRTTKNKAGRGPWPALRRSAGCLRQPVIHRRPLCWLGGHLPPPGHLLVGVSGVRGMFAGPPWAHGRLVPCNRRADSVNIKPIIESHASVTRCKRGVSIAIPYRDVKAPISRPSPWFTHQDLVALPRRRSYEVFAARLACAAHLVRVVGLSCGATDV
jgi:hypothetical protein